MKILIVDDEFASQMLLKTILEPYGQCDIAVDGIEALRAFNSSTDEPYDLILLDIMLPKMDGHQVLKKIREIENARGIFGFDGVKVIMITVLDDLENAKQAYESYCKSYLIKPIRNEKLVAELKTLELI
jgi:two-component system chemotaxis response regulator CheY